MDYYNKIKNELINNEINRKVKNYSINKSDLNTYYNVGKLLFEAGKNYGERIIKDYSLKLSDDLNKIRYYIKIVEEHNLSVRQLRKIIKSKEYERLDEETKIKLINQEQTLVSDFIKNPIFIKNSYNYKEISEKILKKLILEDMK